LKTKPNKFSNTTNRNNRGFALLLWMFFFISAPSYTYETGQLPGINSYKINLSSDVKNALDNGITLTLDCELKTEKTLWLLSIPQNQVKYSFTLTHHSLSNRYLVRYIGAQTPKNFDSAGEATDFISEQSIKFLNQYANKQSDAKMRLSLNKFKLLGPMRLNAFIAKQWDIDTGWISWSPEI